MTARTRPGDAASLHARKVSGQIAAELREARRAAGLSIDTVARAAGMSPAQLSRIERSSLRSPTLEQLWRAAAPLGLRGHAKLYPAGSPVRDRAQLAVARRLDGVLGAPLRLLSEVPLPNEGDLRAWDAMIVGARERCFAEIETRIEDIQALERRMSAKLRDDPRSDVLILVVMRSAHNRQVLGEHREALRSLLPLDGGAILRALRAGRIPKASGILML